MVELFRPLKRAWGWVVCVVVSRCHRVAGMINGGGAGDRMKVHNEFPPKAWVLFHSHHTASTVCQDFRDQMGKATTNIQHPGAHAQHCRCTTVSVLAQNFPGVPSRPIQCHRTALHRSVVQLNLLDLNADFCVPFKSALGFAVCRCTEIIRLLAREGHLSNQHLDIIWNSIKVCSSMQSVEMRNCDVPAAHLPLLFGPSDVVPLEKRLPCFSSIPPFVAFIMSIFCAGQ